MKKYVLTGGHGVGKTSIILALEHLGEYVLREAGSDYQYYLRAKGIPFPLDQDNFEQGVLSLHLQREERLPNGLERVFLDRGKPDHLAYSELFKWPLSDHLQKEAERTDYSAVFFVQGNSEYGIGLCSKREQNESFTLETTLVKLYKRLGYLIHWVPCGLLEERVRYILQVVESLEQHDSN